VGAGPAGISAALRASELGLSFEVIEQGSVAQSIRSFPRGKLVFDQPLELPVGTLLRVAAIGLSLLIALATGAALFGTPSILASPS